MASTSDITEKAVRWRRDDRANAYLTHAFGMAKAFVWLRRSALAGAALVKSPGAIREDIAVDQCITRAAAGRP
ncbi:hypothetical protein C1T17_14225 [Sphingobium sp. SCG-1]|uniref:hypothetical protein n=1 Tax=Sphingobium sp. SCG-1 TaxID=2072936 RepID=UPI000CD687F3|nr:hypothetical protein [Sphingobium sp. SCG-1]AUW59077.1 hypothetical protein C1T17_14225 [Sphingobium sp. SCG-1]